MKITIVYYRVSNDQQGKSGLGLEAQREVYANPKQLLADPILKILGDMG